MWPHMRARPRHNFAVIFDLNGVIVNDLPYHIAACRAVCAHRGVQFTTQEFLQRFNGQTMPEILRALFGKTRARSTLARYAQEKERLYRQLYAPHFALIPGVRQLLRALRARGIPVAIATATHADNVAFVLRKGNIAPYFSVIVNGSRGIKGKPDPAIYTRAITRVGVPAARCVVFEDSPLGIRAAKAAGARVIALSTIEPKRHLRGADAIVKDFTKITVEDIERLVV